MELRGRYIVYYASGKIRIDMNYGNYGREGKFIENYTNGLPSVICNYKNDKLDGEYIEYNHETGRISERLIYDNGKLKNEKRIGL